MVRLIPSQVFVKDPVDVWGKERAMGLAELAVRTHAPAIMYDRRGDVIFWNSFESATDKFYDGGTNAVRSNDTSRRGDFSLKCTTGAAQWDAAGARYYLTDFHPNTTIGGQTSFASDNVGYDFLMYLQYFDGTTAYAGHMRYDYDTGDLQYWSSAGAWVTFGSALGKYNKALKNWATMKLVIDLQTKKYVRALAFGNEYDLSDHGLQIFASANAAHLYAESTFRTADLLGVAKVGYLDDVIITENEPL
jgi:hypothetical protein